MKKLFLLLFITISSSCLFAQENDYDNETSKKNIIKLNLPALALKNITVQYERAIAPKITLAGNFRFMPKGSIPLKNTFIKVADDPETERQLNNLKIGNMAFMPEVRFYLGKKGAFHGFYLAPFASVAKYTAQLLYEYDDNGTTKNISLSGDVNSFTGGLMLGAQWKLSESLFLDWWIVGPHYRKANGDISGKKTLTPTEQQALRDELSGLDIPLTKFTYTVDANGAAINFKGPWAGVRSGICIGFNF